MGLDARILPGNDLQAPTSSYFYYASNTFEVCPHPVSGDRGKKDGTYHNCLSSGDSNEPTVLIIGDSHAAHLFVGLAESFPEESIQFWGFGPEEVTSSSDSGMIRAVLDASNVKLVIFSYRWQGYSAEKFGTPFQIGIAGIADSVGRIAIYNGGPTFPFTSSECEFGRGIFSLFPTCRVSRDTQRTTFTDIDTNVMLPLSMLPDVTIVDSQNYFCSETTCTMEMDGQLFFSDAHHLNIFGSRYSALKSGDQIGELIEQSDRSHVR